MSSSSPLSTRHLRTLCLALVIIGFLAALYGVARRVQAERSSRAVDVVIDYTEAQTLADTQGMPIDTVLAKLQQAGATAVALPEETIKTMAEEGQIALLPRDGWSVNADKSLRLTPATATVSTEPQFTIVTPNPDLHAQVLAGLQRAYADKNVVVQAGNDTTIYVTGSEGSVAEIGLGVSPEKVKNITQAGLRVIPRLLANDGMDETDLRASITSVADALPAPKPGHPRGIVIFDGTAVPGYRALIPMLANELTKHGLVYGSIEFGKQRGDATLGAKLHGQLVRVHSISMDELANMSPGEARQRFALAVKDRNIRVLYVRIPSTASTDPLASAEEYVGGIASTIRGMHGLGFTVSSSAPAHPFTPLTTPSWLLFVLFAGAGASVILWLVTVLPQQLPRVYVRWGYTLVVLGLVAAAGTAVVLPAPGRMLFGLLAAIGFPLLSLTWA
ncbi:MAG TPA: DUF5693 family protein, partial [Armatimonadota bacterium]|nr:DUF5693 family protein [Armatimonadota bacterium]